MTVLDLQVGAGANDGLWRDDEASYSNTGVTNNVGWLDTPNDQLYNWQRFTGISGLSGATIDVSYMDWTGTTANSPNAGGSFSQSILAEESAAPTAPTTAADGNSRVTTTNSVVWSVALVNGNNRSPSLNTVIQEIADTYDPTVIQLFAKFVSADPNANRINRPDSYDYDTTKAPKLHVEYTAGVGVSGEGVVRLGRRHGLLGGLRTRTTRL